jgi:hypothetical protein
MSHESIIILRQKEMILSTQDKQEFSLAVSIFHLSSMPPPHLSFLHEENLRTNKDFSWSLSLVSRRYKCARRRVKSMNEK